MNAWRWMVSRAYKRRTDGGIRDTMIRRLYERGKPQGKRNGIERTVRHMMKARLGIGMKSYIRTRITLRLISLSLTDTNAASIF